MVQTLEYYDVAAVCPLDHTATTVLHFNKTAPAPDLLPDWARHMLRVCPMCLTTTAEHDFLKEHAPAQDKSLSQSLKSPYSRIRDAFAQTLSARIDLVTRHLKDCPSDIWNEWCSIRHERMVARIETTLALLAPTMPPQKLRILAEHLVSLTATRQNLAPIVNKFAGLRLPADSQLAGLLRRGVAPVDLLKSSLFGELAAQSDARELRLTDAADAAPGFGFAQHLLHLQARLDRFSTYTLFLFNRTATWENLLKSGSIRQADAFERAALAALHDYAQDQRAKQGYLLLALGRNYYHLARMLLRQAATPSPAWRSLANAALIEAVQYLEASLSMEAYPDFAPEETVYQLHTKGRIKVPFFFGAPGVRLMLCILYQDILRAALRPPGSHPADEKIINHWTGIHVLFHKLNFGRLEDPTAAQILIPRLIHFARHCPLPEVASRLNQLITQQTNRLYARYFEAAARLAS